MAAHFSFLIVSFVLGLSSFFVTGTAWGQSASVPSTSTALDAEDEAAHPPRSKKNAHPDDGSDLGKVTLETLREKPIYWLCRSRSVVRTLRIEAADGSCRTGYTKDGIEKNISQSQMVSSCISVFANVRRNLESADWGCKDISGARVSSAP